MGICGPSLARPRLDEAVQHATDMLAEQHGADPGRLIPPRRTSRRDARRHGQTAYAADPEGRSPAMASRAQRTSLPSSAHCIQAPCIPKVEIRAFHGSAPLRLAFPHPPQSWTTDHATRPAKRQEASAN